MRMDDEVRGEGRGTISIDLDLGHRATSSGVECREVEFLATLPPLSGLFFFFFFVHNRPVFFNREYR